MSNQQMPTKTNNTRVGLSTRKRRAIVALLSSSSIEAAADECGLHRWTLYKYLKDPAFVAELETRQDAITTAVTTAFVGRAHVVMGVLLDIIEDEEDSSAVRVRAALGWLSHVHEPVVRMRVHTTEVEKIPMNAAEWDVLTAGRRAEVEALE